jgi:hypothetical protein
MPSDHETNDGADSQRDRRGEPGSSEEIAERAVTQTQVLVGTAFVLVLVVALLLKTGYEDPPDLPGSFLYTCIGVIFVGGATGFAEQWMALAWSLYKGANGGPPKEWDTALKKFRERFQPYLVYLLTAGNLCAFTSLVWNTGLSIESPFIPLVTAPAVFGPFVARKVATIIALLVIVGIVLCGITWLLPREPCDGCLTRPVSEQPLDEAGPRYLRAFDEQLHETHQHRPRPGVFLVVGLAFLALATVIAIGRHSKERELREEAIALTAERDVLRALIRRLGGTVPGEQVSEDQAPPEETSEEDDEG